MKRIPICVWLSMCTPALGCDLALLLAVDVSGSVDRNEYAIQMHGLANALRDGAVADALVMQDAVVALMQWTGSTRQRVTLPWTVMDSYVAVDRFARQIEDDERIWRNYSTAIGEGLLAGRSYLDEVPTCKRWVIDVSGDGVSNEGLSPDEAKAHLKHSKLVVNAIAIETDDTDLTAYYFENIIMGEGAFVMTARGFDDYPPQIKRKLYREVLEQVSLATRE